MFFVLFVYKHESLQQIQTTEEKILVYPGLTHSHTMTPFDAPGKQAF